MPLMCPYGNCCRKLTQGAFHCLLAHTFDDIESVHYGIDLEADTPDTSFQASPASAAAAAEPPAATDWRRLAVFRDLAQALPPVKTDVKTAVSEPPAATAQSSQLSDKVSDSTQSIRGMPMRFNLEDYLQKQRKVEWVLVECLGQGMQLRPKGWVFKEVEMAKMD